METVEVVIRIPKYRLDAIKWACKKMPPTENQDLADYVYRDIANGTVLPKGHGKLFDANVLWDAFQDLGQDFYEAFDFAEANAVIEADREVEE